MTTGGTPAGNGNVAVEPQPGDILLKREINSYTLQQTSIGVSLMKFTRYTPTSVSVDIKSAIGSTTGGSYVAYIHQGEGVDDILSLPPDQRMIVAKSHEGAVIVLARANARVVAPRLAPTTSPYKTEDNGVASTDTPYTLIVMLLSRFTDANGTPLTTDIQVGDITINVSVNLFYKRLTTRLSPESTTFRGQPNLVLPLEIGPSQQRVYLEADRDGWIQALNTFSNARESSIELSYTPSGETSGITRQLMYQDLSTGEFACASPIKVNAAYGFRVDITGIVEDTRAVELISYTQGSDMGLRVKTDQQREYIPLATATIQQLAERIAELQLQTNIMRLPSLETPVVSGSPSAPTGDQSSSHKFAVYDDEPSKDQK